MADLSKIKLNGTEYDLKDAIAREQLENGLKILEVTKSNTILSADEITIELEQSYSDLTNYDILKLITSDGRGGLITEHYLNTYREKGSISGRFIASSNNYFSYYSPSNTINNAAILTYYQVEIPILEPMVNVEDMLTSFGLNANANLQSAAAGTAEVGKAVAQ